MDAGSYVFTTGDAVNHQASTADSTGPQANVETIWAIGTRAPQPTGSVDNLIQAEIDDIRVSGRALAPTEIEALYRR